MSLGKDLDDVLVHHGDRLTVLEREVEKLRYPLIRCESELLDAARDVVLHWSRAEITAYSNARRSMNEDAYQALLRLKSLCKGG